MNYNDILKRLALSEKTNLIKEKEAKYTFVVSLEASKVRIKAAIEATFDVKVDSIHTMIRRGKPTRRGQYVGQRKNTKRALVRLKDGHKIAALDEA